MACWLMYFSGENIFLLFCSERNSFEYNSWHSGEFEIVVHAIRNFSKEFKYSIWKAITYHSTQMMEQLLVYLQWSKIL